MAIVIAQITKKGYEPAVLLPVIQSFSKAVREVGGQILKDDSRGQISGQVRHMRAEVPSKASVNQVADVVSRDAVRFTFRRRDVPDATVLILKQKTKQLKQG